MSVNMQNDVPDFKLHKGHGLVTDVFTPADVAALDGIHAIGHTRFHTQAPLSLHTSLSHT